MPWFDVTVESYRVSASFSMVVGQCERKNGLYACRPTQSWQNMTNVVSLVKEEYPSKRSEVSTANALDSSHSHARLSMVAMSDCVEMSQHTSPDVTARVCG